MKRKHKKKTLEKQREKRKQAVEKRSRQKSNSYRGKC